MRTARAYDVRRAGQMVRIHLRMPETQVSDTQLQEVWRALDQDNSGYINAGEFGRFMRRPRALRPVHCRATAGRRAGFRARGPPGVH